MSNRYVVRRGNEWAVVGPNADRASGIFDTQHDAISRAREIVRNLGGVEVTIQRRDGQWRDSDTVPPGSDPFPPRDKR
jgi:hypothetical protein